MRPTKERLQEIILFNSDPESKCHSVVVELLTEIDALTEQVAHAQEVNLADLRRHQSEVDRLREALECARKGLNEYRPRTTVIQEIDKILHRDAVERVTRD